MYKRQALNRNLTLMAAANASKPFQSMHLDPWHKMLVGWTDPRVYAIGPPGRERLAAQHVLCLLYTSRCV